MQLLGGTPIQPQIVSALHISIRANSFQNVKNIIFKIKIDIFCKILQAVWRDEQNQKNRVILGFLFATTGETK